MKLERFHTKCANCNLTFERLNLPPHAYGIVFYLTPSLRAAFLSAEADPIWDEVAHLLSSVPSDSPERHSIFHTLLAETVDRSGSGDKFFPWGQLPCPSCGSWERAFDGPTRPIQFVEVPDEPVTHDRWSRLSEAEKADLAKRSMRSPGPF